MKVKFKSVILGFLIGINTNAQNTINIDCEEVFLSGANIAWSDFASDVGKFSVSNPSILYEPNYNALNIYFSEIKAAGGNSVRWWLHTDASYTPQIEHSGNVTGLSAAYTNQEITDQVRKILDLAWDNGVYMTISLFSFDILSSPNDRNGTSINFVGNQNFLESPTNVQSYIDNALTPIVLALKDHPALFSWEIFNEPEGMSEEFGWTGNQGGVFTSMSTIQMVINKLAGAIHDADPDALVTNGAWSMLVNTDIDLNFSYAEEYQKNYYSDSELIAAGGAANGTLDFYQVHYYNWPENVSPLHHPASYWELDKPIMLGEFHAAEVQSIAVDNGYPVDGAYEFLYDQGYFGAWGWQWKSPWLKTDIEPQITHMQTAHPTIVDINMDNCPDNTLDDDNDGVTNDVDLCLDTPDGETVNSDGCSTNDLGDSDNDGVINGVDTCPNTPNGESVDANGCSANEQLDDDGDGVLNGYDLCSSTPTNEIVNNNGCSGSQLDDDQDGVTNNLDHCENTPIGETVNANGCTDNQIDDDQDGVINELDLCPNSPSNASVNSDGCVIITIPDANFEQELINLGIDKDGLINQEMKYMYAQSVTQLFVQNKNISDLTGIEAFKSLNTLWCQQNNLTSLNVNENTSLQRLFCHTNSITNLDVSQNTSLIVLHFAINQLTSLDLSNNSNLNEVYGFNNQLEVANIRNGNNTIIPNGQFNMTQNPNLSCIQVDDTSWSNANWTNIDAQASFSEDCGYALNVEEQSIEDFITLYPNPTNDILTLKANFEIEKLIIYNLLGEEKDSYITEDILNNQINVGSYATGVYFIKVLMDGKTNIVKFIRE